MIHASDTPQIYLGHIPFIGKSYRVRDDVRLFAGDTGTITALDMEGKCAVVRLDGCSGVGKVTTVFAWSELVPA